MNRLIYVLGFFACFLLSTGMLFRLMHWPSANIQLLSGFVILNFGVLPVYFYGKYKQA